MRSAVCIPRLLVDREMFIFALSLLAYFEPYCFFCFGGKPFLFSSVLTFTVFSICILGL